MIQYKYDDTTATFEVSWLTKAGVETVVIVEQASPFHVARFAKKLRKNPRSAFRYLDKLKG